MEKKLQSKTVLLGSALSGDLLFKNKSWEIQANPEN